MPNLNKISIGGVVYDLVGEAGPQGPKGDTGGTGTLTVDETTLTYEENSEESSSYIDPEYLEEVLDDYYDKTEVNTLLSSKTNTSDMNAALAEKANTSDMNAALAEKANTSDMNTALATKANTSDMNAALATKANSAAVNTALAQKADRSTVESALNLKLDASSMDITDISSSYTFTKSSGNCTVNSLQVYKYGKYIVLAINAICTAATNVGSNVLSGTLTGGPLPIIAAKSIGSYKNSAIAVFSISTEGEVLIRAIGSDKYGSANLSVQFQIEFLTND